MAEARSNAQFGIASLLKSAPKDMVDTVRKGSVDPLIPVPERPQALNPSVPAPVSQSERVPGSFASQLDSGTGSKPVEIATVPAQALTSTAVAPEGFPTSATTEPREETKGTVAVDFSAASAELNKQNEQDLQRLEFRMAREQTVAALRSQLKEPTASRPVSRLLASVRPANGMADVDNSRSRNVAVAMKKSSDLQSVLAYHLAPRGSSKRAPQKAALTQTPVRRPASVDPRTESRIRVFTEISDASSQTRFRRLSTGSGDSSQTQLNDSTTDSFRQSDR